MINDRNTPRGNARDLAAWREAIALLAEVHLLVKRFPEGEQAHLGDRLYRAAVAVPASIADGHEMNTRAAFLPRLHSAAAALSELGALLELADQLGHLQPGEAERLEHARKAAAAPLRGLIARVERDLDAGRARHEGSPGRARGGGPEA